MCTSAISRVNMVNSGLPLIQELVQQMDCSRRTYQWIACAYFAFMVFTEVMIGMSFLLEIGIDTDDKVWSTKGEYTISDQKPSSCVYTNILPSRDGV